MNKEVRLRQPSIGEVLDAIKPLETILSESEYERRSLGSFFWEKRKEWFKNNPNRLPNPYTKIADLLNPPVGGA